MPGGWQAVTLAGDGADVPITAYLRTINGTRVVVAADHGEWRVDYAQSSQRLPRSVRIRSADGRHDRLTAVVDELEINAAIDDKAFEVTVHQCVAMTLDDLQAWRRYGKEVTASSQFQASCQFKGLARVPSSLHASEL